jgi:hypothetical protein
VIKTTSDRVAAVERGSVELHPYELPEFLVITADAGSEAYLTVGGGVAHAGLKACRPGLKTRPTTRRV